LNYSSGYHNSTPLYHINSGRDVRVIKRLKCDNKLYTSNQFEVLFCDGERIICDVNELTLKYLID